MVGKTILVPHWYSCHQWHVLPSILVRTREPFWLLRHVALPGQFRLDEPDAGFQRVPRKLNEPQPSTKHRLRISWVDRHMPIPPLSVGNTRYVGFG